MPIGVYKRTEIHRKILSKAFKKNYTEGQRISWNRGKVGLYSEEYKTKLRKNHKGMEGKCHTEKSKEKMRDAKLDKGKIISENKKDYKQQWHKINSFGSIERYNEAMNKYDGWCAFACDREATLVHHMDGKNVRNSNREKVDNDLGNLLPLCDVCHKKLHNIVNHRKRIIKNSERRKLCLCSKALWS